MYKHRKVVTTGFKRAQGLLGVLFVLLMWNDPALAVNRSWENPNGGDWSTASDWSPNGVPSAVDTVRIGNFILVENDWVHLDQNDTVAEVHITDGMTLSTDGHTLLVNGDTFISGENKSEGNVVYPSRLSVDRGAGADDYDTDNLYLTDEGRVSLINGGVLEVDNLLDVGTGSVVRGDGIIRLPGAGTVYSNDGLLDPSTDGMTIDVSGGGQLDLDGSTGGGGIGLSSARIDGSGFDNLTINGGTVADAFSGEISITANGFLAANFSAPWSTDSSSEIKFHGNSLHSGPATISGADLTLAGFIDVLGAEAHGRFDANTTFASSAEISVGPTDRLEMNGATVVEGGNFTLEEGGEIDFDGPTTVEGGTFNTFSDQSAGGRVDFNGLTTYRGDLQINGFARQVGDATVSQTTVISGDTFDLDGASGTEWDINANLELHVNRIDNTNNIFNGLIDIGGSIFTKLTVEITDPQSSGWTMSGTLNLAGNGMLFANKLAGSEVNVIGTVNVDNLVGVTADTNFFDSSTIVFNDAATVLRLIGKTEVAAGAIINGTGTLEIGGGGLMSLEEGLSTGQVGVINRGVLQLGDTAGVVAVDRFENLSTGTLYVDVGKNDVGTDSDVLSVSSGTAELAGSLRPRLVHVSGPDEPLVVGDSFTVLTAVGGVNQTFEQVLDSLQGGQVFSWDVTYNPSNVVIELTSIIEGLFGDYDYDGDVDGADFLKWQLTLGSTTDLMADGNLDGTVNAPDLAIWQANYGMVAPLLASASVPEPATLVIGIFGAVTLLGRRNR